MNSPTKGVAMTESKQKLEPKLSTGFRKIVTGGSHKQLVFSRRRFLKTSALSVSAAVFGGPLVTRGSAASTAANSKLNLAVIGCGGQGCGDMSGMLSSGEVNLVALCDPDAKQVAEARAKAGERGGNQAKAYEDYRKLLDDAASFDAVLIATPDHWHAPLCKAFLRAGKHVYCEKPLAHSVAEARQLRELARASKVITQMGNQGSASASLRRGIEIIKAGALGPVREVYQWGIYFAPPREGVPEGADAVPAGFNWDLWVGPSPLRPFKEKVYHPKNWRGWFDFGNGSVADFWCHAANLPVRALDLGYPDRVGMKRRGYEAAVEYHFPARGVLPPVTLYWNTPPPADKLAPVAEVFKEKDGVLIVGEKGCIYTTNWNMDGLIRLDGEPRLKSVLQHEATKEIPASLPRVKGHAAEWLDACRGVGQTFSNFDTGGLLTEIGLAGLVAVRAGKDLEWDGAKMEARNAPEAARFVHPELRTKWLV
jgi:predicted dehydrogenase